MSLYTWECFVRIRGFMLAILGVLQAPEIRFSFHPTYNLGDLILRGAACDPHLGRLAKLMSAGRSVYHGSYIRRFFADQSGSHR
jgi:hypothetical protein